MEEVEKDVVIFKIKTDGMAKMQSTEDPLGWDGREIIVWHHRLNHCTFKSLLILSNKVILPRNHKKVRKLAPCVS